MKANHQINGEFWPNEHHFGNQFFGRYTLHKAPKPLQLSESVSKNYWFPTFYANSTCAIAIFHCDWAAAQAMMPCASMQAIKMFGGRSLVVFAIYEYNDAYNIPPYYEIGMSIPVMTDNGRQLPILNMLLGDKLDKFGYHVFHMPVTSQENVIRGEKIWGMPKTLENIDIQRTDEQLSVTASVGDETPYFAMTLPVQGESKHFDVKSNVYSVKDDLRLKSGTAFIGDFILHKNTKNLVKPDHESTALITLGEGEVADQLRGLQIESQPLQTRFCDDFNACFDLPMAEQAVID